MGNVVSSPAGSEAEFDLKRIWLLYCCEYYTGGSYVDESESSTRKLATADRSRVSIHVAKLFS